MEISKRMHRLLATVAIVMFSTCGGYLLHLSSLLDTVEWNTFDKRMALFRSAKEINDKVAVVLIDEASLQVMNPIVGRWPWPRSVYADLIEFMESGGASAVVFDLLFTENSRGHAKNAQLDINDRRLIEATRSTGIAYHAAQVYTDIPDEYEVSRQRQTLPTDYLTRFSLRVAPKPVDKGNNSFVLPLDGLYQASRGVGIVGIEPDKDGVYRRAQLLFNYQGHVFPALATVAHSVLNEAKTIAAEDTHLQFGSVAVPLDDNQHYLVNMLGKYHAYSMGGVLESIQAIHNGNIENLPVDPIEFQGKIVFIGASAAGLEDVKPTAISAKTPGVYIHAAIASNLFENDFLRTIPGWLVLVLVVVIGSATTSGILYSHSLTIKIAIPFLLAASFTAFAIYSFKYNWVVPVTLPLTALAISLLTSLTYLTFTEGKDKRRVRNMLSQYVSPAVLAEVVDKYQDHIGAQVGKREHLTILFSDVRGFTSFSEKLAAEQVVEMLNIHFGVMTEIIFANKGTLDKFIGDAIMAFWGAPIRDNRHADLAVQSALDMTRGLESVNQQLAQHGYPEIKIGIGINTGDVVLGNIGSEKKLDYTVIGDNVNLASRLEGLTSKYQCPILISEYTHQELSSEIICGVVDLVQVKGKSVPIKLYWPLAHTESDASAISHARKQAELMEHAFTCYLQQEWDAAESYYDKLAPSQFRDLFIQRCQEFRNNPPGSDWDGVFVLNSK